VFTLRLPFSRRFRCEARVSDTFFAGTFVIAQVEWLAALPAYISTRQTDFFQVVFKCLSLIKIYAGVLVADRVGAIVLAAAFVKETPAARAPMRRNDADNFLTERKRHEVFHQADLR